MTGSEVGKAWREALLAGDAALLEVDGTSGAVTVIPGSMLGQPDDPVVHEELLARIHPDDRQRVGAGLEEALAGGERAYREEFRTLEGTWIAARGKVLRGRRLLAVLTVEAERREADEARMRAIQELSLAARSSEVFVSMLAHDLKNPIGVLMATAHTLLDGPPGPHMRRGLERIRSNADRLTRMIGHIRDYARGRPGGLALERRETELAPIVERAIASIGSEHSVEVTSNGDSRGVWDDAHLEHALTTLLDTAGESAPPESSVQLVIDGTDETVVELRIAHLGVLDQRTVENAFRPFGAEGEQGLGLFAARQAIVAHGAEVTVESAPGKGTVFLVRLPRRLAAITGTIAAGAWDEILTADAAAPASTSVTASLYGALPLYERAPVAYWKIFERYAAVFDEALNRRVYRGEAGTVGDETRAIAEAFGSLGAGAQEVAELHARALRLRLRGASPGRSQALIAEGRLLAFELMGHLVTWYRRRSTFAGRDRSGSTETET